jgi:hypothetical protein
MSASVGKSRAATEEERAEALFLGERRRSRRVRRAIARADKPIQLRLPVEEAGNRALLEHLTDRPCDQGRNR